VDNKLRFYKYQGQINTCSQKAGYGNGYLKMHMVSRQDNLIEMISDGIAHLIFTLSYKKAGQINFISQHISKYNLSRKKYKKMKNKIE